MSRDPDCRHIRDDRSLRFLANHAFRFDAGVAFDSQDCSFASLHRKSRSRFTGLPSDKTDHDRNPVRDQQTCKGDDPVSNNVNIVKNDTLDVIELLPEATQSSLF